MSEYCCDHHKEEAEEERKKKARQKWHDMLDQAMDNTKEGIFFLPEFTKLVMDDLMDYWANK